MPAFCWRSASSAAFLTQKSLSASIASTCLVRYARCASVSFLYNVTIDLNGYTISGPVKCAAQGSCDATSTNSHGVQFLYPNGVLRNGNVMGFAGNGVYASAAATLEDLTVTQNTDHGVYGGSALQGTLVNRVKARQNGLTGFSLWGATITDCISAQNGQHGFSVTSSTLIDGMAAYNGGAGVYAGSMVMLRGVRAASNSGGNFNGNYSSAGGNMND